METSMVEIIRVSSISSALIPICIYFYFFKKMPGENHIIGSFCALSLILDLIVTYQYSNGVSNALWINSYYLLFFAMGSWFYYKVLFVKVKQIYFYSGLACYAFALGATTINLRGIFEYQNEAWAFGGAILVVFGILLMNHFMEKPPVLDKNLYSVLFINGGIFLYFSFNLFLFSISNYVLTEMTQEISRMSWAFHNINNIMKNVAFALGLYYTNRRQIELTKAQQAALE